MTGHAFFPTLIHQSDLRGHKDWADLHADLEATSYMLAEDDTVGQAWCEANGYDGYTSYSSLNDLPQRATCFAELARLLKKEADAFAETLQWDMTGRKLALDNIWVNILAPGGGHTGHIHPHSVISGTYYVRIPRGASALRFEDPRLPFMMAAPMPREDCDRPFRRFVTIAPEPGDLLMWESWLRHEVSVNRAEEERISISFNFRID